MTFDGSNVHILGLTPKEQFLIKLLMTNLMAGYLDKVVSEAVKAEHLEATDKSASQVVALFTRYSDFVDMLCPESMLGRARSKVLMIKPDLMRYVVLACNGWDPYNNYLSRDQRAMLEPAFVALQKKVAESFNYTYNRYEIERAKQS